MQLAALSEQVGVCVEQWKRDAATKHKKQQQDQVRAIYGPFPAPFLWRVSDLFLGHQVAALAAKGGKGAN